MGSGVITASVPTASLFAAQVCGETWSLQCSVLVDKRLSEYRPNKLVAFGTAVKRVELHEPQTADTRVAGYAAR